jgi:hypothetical protein
MATKITPEIIELIKKYRIENKLGSGKLSEILKANHDLDVGRSTITKILKKLKDQGVKGIAIPMSELASSVAQRLDPKIPPARSGKRKIYKLIRPVRELDLKQNPSIPKNAKFKVQVPTGIKTGEGPTTEMKYFKTKEAAEEGIKVAEAAVLKAKNLKSKPFDDAVKEIHKIALKDADEISDINNLAKLVYGDNKLRQLTDVSNDLVRYQQFLLGFKEIPGLKTPTGNTLDNILTEFPSQNQWGKFAANELRRSKFQIRDKLLKTKGKKLTVLRDNILKAIDTGAYNLDEAMGLSATFENAPGYTELGQVIKKKVNTLKGREIDKPFSKLFKDTIDGKADIKDITAFNEKSNLFRIKHGVDTPIIEYKPGEKLDASKFVKHFDKLSPEAQVNITELADKGIVLQSNAMPISSSAFNSAKSKLISSADKLPKIEQLKLCSLLSNGGLPGDCKQAIKKDPEKAAKILSEAPVTSAAMNNVKKDSQKLIRLYRGFEPNRTDGMRLSRSGMYDPKLKGRFFFDNPEDARWYAQRQGTLTGNVKSVDVPENMAKIGSKMAIRRRGPNYGSEVILPKKFVGQEKINIPQTAMARAGAIVDKIKSAVKYNKDAGTFVNTTTNAPDTNFNAKAYAENNPIDVKAGTEDALKPIKGNLLKTVGKSLAYVGAPLPTALIDSYFVGKQISEDRSAAEIAKDPLNWLGLATMSTLSNISGVTKPGKVNAALRLGMSPGLIRGVSRFAGIPGLAISTALTAYDQYNKYKNEEGLIYNLFNDKAKAV